MKIPHTPENSKIIATIAEELQRLFDSQANGNNYFAGDQLICSSYYNENHSNYVVKIIFRNESLKQFCINFYDCDNRRLRPQYIGQMALPSYYLFGYAYLKDRLDQHFS